MIIIPTPLGDYWDSPFFGTVNKERAENVVNFLTTEVEGLKEQRRALEEQNEDLAAQVSDLEERLNQQEIFTHEAEQRAHIDALKLAQSIYEELRLTMGDFKRKFCWDEQPAIYRAIFTIAVERALQVTE